MNEIIKLVFDILSFSCIMVLVVGGLAIIASLMGIFNFAHGEFVLLGPIPFLSSEKQAFLFGVA